jgi:hypothetical protein
MSHLFVTVEFADQLADVTQPLDSLEEGQRIVDNEVEYSNTIQAYVWNSTNGLVLYCQHGPAAALPADLNIDTLVEDYRI